MTHTSRKHRIGGGVGQVARGRSRVGSDRQLIPSLIIRQCPITSGLPTRMTAAAWDRACRRMREQVRRGVEASFRYNRGGYCVLCRGDHLPAELEIINVEEIMGSAKNLHGACDLCGKKTNLRNNHGMACCSMCQSLQARVINSPQVVVRAMRALLPPDKFVEVLDAEAGIGLTVESSALEAIAEMVGYTGTDGDALLEAVAVATSASGGQQERIEVLAEELELAHARLKELDDAMDVLREILESPEDVAVVDAVRDMADDWRGMLLADGWKPSPDTIRALGLPEGTTSWSPVELAAMQIAAVLEDTERDLHQAMVDAGMVLGQLERLSLAAGVDTYGLPPADCATKIIETIAQMGNGMEQMRAQLATAYGEVDQRQQRLDSSQETIEQLRHIVDAVCTELRVSRDIDLPEIPWHVAELRMRAESVALPYTIEGTTPSRRLVLDSHLLDLLIEFPQIGAERIAVLREVG